MNKKIVVLVENNQSQFYDFLMKGFSLKSKIEKLNITYLTGNKIPAFCSDLVGYDERDDRDYQFQSIYNYANFVAADGAIIAYNCDDNNGLSMRRKDLEAMLGDIPRVYINMEGSSFDDATSVDRGYFLGKTSVDVLLDMISNGQVKATDISYDADSRKNVASPSESKSTGLDESELFATINEYAQKNLKLRTQSWGISFMMRDLIEFQGSIEDNFKLFLNKVTILGLRDVHFFLIRELNEYKSVEDFKLPTSMFYAGGITAHGVRDVDWKDHQGCGVNLQKGIYAFLPDDGVGEYQAYMLFAGDIQYGLMLIKDDPKDRETPFYMSLQIGNLMKLVFMKHDMEETSREMEKTLERVKESNQILAAISHYDELTKILNRRGFMERALAKMSKHMGKQACIMFADVDHLKEINDSFGHADGDFAITTAASLLSGSIPKDGLCARLGGDEFIAFVPLSSEDPAGEVEEIRRKLKDSTFAFNVTCDKPYFVELSLGYHIFTCEEGVDFASMISMSDSWLYEDKQRRRASIKKNI